MSENSEEFITFLTRFGIFKYFIMPFGLCNKPILCQYLINNILFGFLPHFIQAYVADILIYSKILKDHFFTYFSDFRTFTKSGYTS